MYIKKDDSVIVVSGKDKGKSGKVIKSLPKIGKVVVADINVMKKHQRPRQQGKKGQVVEVAMPMDASNVMLIDPKTKKKTRIGKSRKGGKVSRIAKGSNTTI